MNSQRKRCPWAAANEEMWRYHDVEWGVPVHDDRRLFEFLILEGAQAGLSWSTILRKREGYRKAFAGFEAVKIARFTEERIAKVLAGPGIVRNRLKVAAAVTNARAFLELQAETGSFDAFLWGFVGGKPKLNHWKAMQEVPPTSPESDAIAKALKRRGFKFCGSTMPRPPRRRRECPPIRCRSEYDDRRRCDRALRKSSSWPSRCYSASPS